MTTIATKYPFAGSIETKQGGRAENQDNAGYVDTPLGLLLVVCDGMGGGPGGRTASLMAVDTIQTTLSNVSEHTPRENALKFAIEKANDIIYAKANENPELRGMGTTVAALLINETSAVIAHAGDTRVYQLRKGAIAFRTSDHSYVAELVRKKKLTEEEARNHPRSNMITRALGIRPNMEIEFDEVSFLRGDRFVICSDGIWGMLPQRDLVKSLSRVMGIGELTVLTAEEIDKLGQEKGGGHDNLTLAILDTSFDSDQKGNKKKCKTENGDASTTTCIGHSNRKRTLWTIVTTIIIILLSIVAAIYKMIPQQEKKVNQNPDGNWSEETTRAPIQPAIREEEEEEEEESEEPGMVSFQENIEEITNDSTFIIEYNKAVSERINNVIKNLDELKKNSKNPRKTKKIIIDYAIKPELDILLKIVVEDKRPFVIKIKSMLDDEKIMSSKVRKGKKIPEDIEHIEKIKFEIEKLKILKDR